jgi:dihydrofolate reductase
VIDVGEWYVADGEHDRAGKEQLRQASPVLLGRNTYEGLAAYWSPLDDEWANLINPKPKHVASRTLHGQLEWNATLLEGDTSDAVARLKAELPSDLLVYGCGELARSLLGAALVDELRFWVHPALWAAGERPLQGAVQSRVRLVESEAFDSGVTLLRYDPLGAPPASTRVALCMSGSRGVSSPRPLPVRAAINEKEERCPPFSPITT